MNNRKKQIKKKKPVEGITLVALVVTIVVLLTLAGITITYVMGDNSVFKQAQEAKLQTDIAKWQEMLETAKTPIIIEGLGKFNPDNYFDYIEEQGIIEDKETNVVDNGDGTYDVTTKPGYIFEVELMPNKENPTDAKIEYIGQAGKIAPIIKRIETSTTPTSITAKAIVKRLGNGTVTYYYKLKTDVDSEYKEITNVNTETGATVTEEIVAGIEYVIKVVAKNEVGETVDTVEIRATKTFVESITLDKTEGTIKVGDIETLIATIKPEDSTNKNVIWTSSNPEVAVVSDKGVVVGKTIGTTTITVSTTDGSGKSATCEIKVIGITTAIELNSVRARIATGSTRWLTATAEPTNAPQEFEWSSSNTNVATVDSTGKITTKAVGTTTITVKTKDGTNLSKTCNVTVANGVSITSLTSIQSSNKVAKDGYGNLITVPGGFKVRTNEATNVTQGIVIQDSEGNEFVWVPVDSVSKGTSERADDIRLGRYSDFRTKNASGNYIPVQEADNYMQIVNLRISGSNYDFQELTSDSENIAAKNLGDFITKTQANGGYYLGRYEASQGSDGKVDSQVDKAAWGYITQKSAAALARGMYNSSYVESDLINSYSWDTAIIFIQKYSGNSNYANENSVNNSNIGILNTGKTGDKVCNIHDMASNCMEMSTEHNTSKHPYVIRGGRCLNYNFRTSQRGNSGGGSMSDITFRILLYVK